MLVPIYQHFNVRHVCDLDLGELEVAALAVPNRNQTGQPHVLTIKTTAGDVVLFPVVCNGTNLVVTNTPDTAKLLWSGAATRN